MADDASTVPLRPETLRTPEARFTSLSAFPWAPRYTAIDGYRMAHVEAGPADGPVVLCLHGEPTWSFLYRTVFPPLVAAGRRPNVETLGLEAAGVLYDEQGDDVRNHAHHRPAGLL